MGEWPRWRGEDDREVMWGVGTGKSRVQMGRDMAGEFGARLTCVDPRRSAADPGQYSPWTGCDRPALETVKLWTNLVLICTV